MEARSLIYRMTERKIEGRVSTELATLFVDFTKITKAAKVGQLLQKLKQLTLNVRISKRVARILHSQVVVATKPLHFARIERRLVLFEKTHVPKPYLIANLVNVGNIGKLGQRGGNKRVHLILVSLFEAEQGGDTASDVLKKAFVAGKAHTKNRKRYYDPELAKAQLLKNYQQAQEWNIFDNPENIERMKLGQAPIIQAGKYKGQKVEVDHIIPLALMEELDNNYSNLMYLPKKLNAAKGERFTQESQELAYALNECGLLAPEHTLLTREPEKKSIFSLF